MLTVNKVLFGFDLILEICCLYVLAPNSFHHDVTFLKYLFYILETVSSEDVFTKMFLRRYSFGMFFMYLSNPFRCLQIDHDELSVLCSHISWLPICSNLKGELLLGDRLLYRWLVRTRLKSNISELSLNIFIFINIWFTIRRLNTYKLYGKGFLKARRSPKV